MVWVSIGLYTVLCSQENNNGTGECRLEYCIVSTEE